MLQKALSQMLVDASVKDWPRSPQIAKLQDNIIGNRKTMYKAIRNSPY